RWAASTLGHFSFNRSRKAACSSVRFSRGPSSHHTTARGAGVRVSAPPVGFLPPPAARVPGRRSSGGSLARHAETKLLTAEHAPPKPCSFISRHSWVALWQPSRQRCS